MVTCICAFLVGPKPLQKERTVAVAVRGQSVQKRFRRKTQNVYYKRPKKYQMYIYVYTYSENARAICAQLGVAFGFVYVKPWNCCWSMDCRISLSMGVRRTRSRVNARSKYCVSNGCFCALHTSQNNFSKWICTNSNMIVFTYHLRLKRRR